MGELYCLTSPSGRSYIGITSKTAQARFVAHVRDATYVKGGVVAIHRAIRKYGPSGFKVRTLVVADDLEYLRVLEQRAIAAFKTLSPHGYNLTVGGDGVRGFSEEAAKHHRERTIAALNTPEHRALRREIGRRNAERHSQALRALWADPEWRERTITSLRAAAARRRGQTTPKPKNNRQTRAEADVAHSERMKQLWKDSPERFAASRATPPHTEEFKQRRSDEMKALWRDAEYRDKMTQTRRAKMATPDYREKQRLAAQRGWEKRRGGHNDRRE